MREVARPHFPKPEDGEIVSPIGIRRLLFNLESQWLKPYDLTVEWRQASHEQKGVRNEYREQVEGLDIWSWNAIDTSESAQGIAAIQSLLEIDMEQVNPFRVYPSGHPMEGQQMRGRAQFYLVVANGQGEVYFDKSAGELRVVEPIDELGFNLTRYEFPRYRYPSNAQGAEANKPIKSEDNAMDALKASVARCKPYMQPLTPEQRLALKWGQVFETNARIVNQHERVIADMSARYHMARDLKRAEQGRRYGLGAIEDEEEDEFIGRGF